MNPPFANPAFDKLVSGDAGRYRLAHAALLLACDHCPGLKPRVWLKQLDALAMRVERLGAQSREEQVAALQTVLAEQEGFTGDQDDYYNPRNSFLHEVLRRKRGLPIALSVVWLDVARQLGWPFFGATLPGHVIVCRQAVPVPIMLDPFDHGRQLSMEDCAAIQSGAQGREVSPQEVEYALCDTKTILTRMLHNLIREYMRTEDWCAAACVISRLVALYPEADELREQLENVKQMVAVMN